MTELWYVAQAGGGREDAAKSALDSRGFEVFLPKYMARLGPRPMFSTYLFVAFDARADTRYVTGCVGVTRLLGVGAPEPVRAGVVEALMDRVGPTGVLDIGEGVEACVRAVVGRSYRVTGGPLEGLVGECVASGSTRAKLLLCLLGGKTGVQVEHEWLEPDLLASTETASGRTSSAAAISRYDKAARSLRGAR